MKNPYTVTPIHFLNTDEVMFGQEAIDKGEHGLGVFNSHSDVHTKRMPLYDYELEREYPDILLAAFRFTDASVELQFRREIDLLSRSQSLGPILKKYKDFAIQEDERKSLIGETPFDSMLKRLIREIEGRSDEGFGNGERKNVMEGARKFFMTNKAEIAQLCQAE